MVIRPLSPLSSGRALLGLSPLLDLHRDMNRLFEGAFRDADRQGGAPAFSPSLDLVETADELRFTVDLPGMSEADVDLRLEGDLLVISGERKAPSRQDGETWHMAERAWGSFERSIKLPFTPDAGRVTATFEAGVLRVSVPKAAVQEKGRRIQIQSGIASPAQPALTEESAKAKSDEVINRASKKSEASTA